MALIASRRERVIRAAEKLVARGRLQAAIKEYRKVLDQTPDDTNTLNRVGDLYARLDHIDEAVELFRQIAGFYERDGFLVKAIAIYKKILRLDPAQLDLHATLGDLYRRQGLVIEARAQFRLLADTYRDEKDLEGCLTVHGKLLELEPESLGIMGSLVELYEQRGSSEEARDGYHFMAGRMLEHGDTEGVEEIYVKALDSDVADSDFVAKAVTRLRKKGQPEVAQRVLKAALAREPDSVDLLTLTVFEPEADKATPAATPTETESRTPPAAPSVEEASPAKDEESEPSTAPSVEPQPSEDEDFDLDLDQLESPTQAQPSAEAAATDASSAEATAADAGTPEAGEEVYALDLQRLEAAAEPTPAKTDTRGDSLLAEVGVFIKYGLTDKAIECLEQALQDDPDDPQLLQQLLRIYLGEERHEAVLPLAARLEAGSAESSVAEVWKGVQRDLKAAGYGFAADQITAPAAVEETDEAEVEAAPPRDVVSVDENIAWLEELAQATRTDEPARMFDSEEEFFDLAAELEDELDTDIELAAEPAGEPTEGPSLDRIVETFRQKIGENLSESDFETHFSLGIAYREMGLLDESISEFQLAAKDSRYLVDCCSLLGVSFLEKGFPDLAVKWYKRGLEADSTEPTERLGLLYELGSLYQSIGDVVGAQESYSRIHEQNPDYRDVSARLRALEAKART